MSIAQTRVVLGVVLVSSFFPPWHGKLFNSISTTSSPHCLSIPSPLILLIMFKTARAMFSQSRPPKSKFSTDQIPDLTGRVVIVTGGNVGVGKETVKALLEHNAKVYMGSRSKSKAEAAIKELKETTGKEAIFLELDLGSLASVQKAAEEFLSKENELHQLYLNAGVMTPPIELLTADGYDLQFGTNVIGHFLFTKLLLPALLAGKQSSPDKHARVIATSSSAAYFSTINYDTLRDGPARKKKGTQQLYAQSKFGNAVFARELARRYGPEGIIAMSCNPGNLKTDLQRHLSPIQKGAINALLYPASYGALTQLWGGTMPETLQYNGEFLIPWARLGKCRSEVYDQATGEKLWDWLEEQVKPYVK